MKFEKSFEFELGPGFLVAALLVIIGALCLLLQGCSGIQLTVDQYKCIDAAEEEASMAALAYCETNWDECAHSDSIRNDFREDVNKCLGIKEEK